MVERVGELAEVDDPARPGAGPRHAEALALEPGARAEHRLVLDGGGDDAVGAGRVSRGPRRALHPEVVALGPTSGEHDFAWLAAARISHGLPGGLERRLGRSRLRVHPRRVREEAGQERLHCFARLGP